MNSNDHKYTNELIHESSPYLLQHAHNPVNWLPWGEEALQKAKDENKLLLVSIGYAACHWCHVMEHESFEDTNVAKVMNEHFVCIKVDREERPDIDQIYMDACQLIQKSGGWPLNAFALPDGRPIYAGTYYPKDNWLKVMNQINEYYHKNPEESKKRAESITQGINNMESIVKVNKTDQDYKDLEPEIWKSWKHSIDYKWGGRTGAPKFPMPVGWEYLLQYHAHSENQKALEAVSTTLDKMAFGGLYDQIGGGFARYSVDAHWKAPHFEKMLYDNGQLLSLYANAYKLTNNQNYKTILLNTIEFATRELMHKNGGFYSSLDADSEGEEGKFYVWSKDDFIQTLENAGIKETDYLADYYNIKSGGNWEGHNILWLNGSTPEEFATNNNLDLDNWNKTLAQANSILLKERDKRIRPGLDDKILTSWNALMLSGLCDAYQATGEKHILQLAQKNATFILSNLMQDSSLYRNYKYSKEKGKASITGFLDDYALLSEALIKLYQVTFNEEYLLQSRNLVNYSLDYFFDDKTGMFFYTPSNGEKLIARKLEITDNVIPSSNSVMAKNLYLLGNYFGNQKWKDISKQMLDNTLDNIVNYGPYYANWGQLFLLHNKPTYEVAIVGDDFTNLLAKMQKSYHPNVLYLGAKSISKLPLLQHKYQKGVTTIYVCSGGICKQPTTDVNEALEMLR